MKIRKALFVSSLVALLVGLVPSEIAAQNFQRPAFDAEKLALDQTTWFAENFELSEEQTTEIDKIHLTYAEKRGEMMSNMSFPPSEDFRNQMAQIDVDKEAELKEILTEDQWKIFEEKKDEYSSIGRMGRPGGGRPN